MPASPERRATPPLPLLARFMSRWRVARSVVRPIKTGQMRGISNRGFITLTFHHLWTKRFGNAVRFCALVLSTPSSMHVKETRLRSTATYSCSAIAIILLVSTASKVLFCYIFLSASSQMLPLLIHRGPWFGVLVARFLLKGSPRTESGKPPEERLLSGVVHLRCMALWNGLLYGLDFVLPLLRLASNNFPVSEASGCFLEDLPELVTGVVSCLVDCA